MPVWPKLYDNLIESKMGSCGIIHERVVLKEYDTMARMILGSGGKFLSVIVVGRLPECVVCVLDEFRGGIQGIPISKITPIFMFIHTVRCANPR